MTLHTNPRQISEEFSKGNFEFAFGHLSENISWNIVGTELLTGKVKVIEYCNNTSAYFKEVETDFRVIDVMVDGDRVAITGMAVFINREQKKTEVSSCDVYRFDDGILKEIVSYCIVTNKDNYQIL